MKHAESIACLCGLLLALTGTELLAQAANPPQGASAQQEAGDPRVNTSSDAAGSRDAGTAAASRPLPKPTPGGSATQAVPAEPQAPAGKSAFSGKSPKGSKNAADRVDLDTTTITGNRELPKVLYIVPWKRADIGDLIGRPVNSLLDEVLAPVDRDVFRREVVYYQALKPDASATAGAPAPGSEAAH